MNSTRGQRTVRAKNLSEIVKKCTNLTELTELLSIIKKLI